ncbi:NAD-dependent epimerase/dehydratase family protein [Pseudaestuariivita sp.]|uniref:NAD-dependent epimerase/dehydratase family protein n=1 Tax=Pseudaestuariivita sp. TaxID=2211669 RepID=UPI00405816E5
MSELRTALVTGAAGFIGYHLSLRLLKEGWRVVGLDNMSPYYDPALKDDRLAALEAYEAFVPAIAAVEEPGVLASLMEEYCPEIVVHLAAQAGVRYSIEAPRSYVQANLCGTFEVLEAARAYKPQHLLIASTSSAYGANTEMPYRETMQADHQMSFYAATKRATEAMAHSYAHLYDIPTTMFRFFTVYGPWGRPDMALFKFVSAALKGQPIDVYNNGEMRRDFTYVADLVEGICRLSEAVPKVGERHGAADTLSPVAPWRVVNIGNGAPVPLLDFIAAIEDALGLEIARNLMPMQAGDVPATWAATTLLTGLVGELPRTDLSVGVGEFVRWYRARYREN